MQKKVEQEFRVALARVEQALLKQNLDGLRAGLKESTSWWHKIQPTVARMKIDQVIDPSETRILLGLMRGAARAGHVGLRTTSRFVFKTLKPTGMLDVVVRNARRIAPDVQLKSLPPFDVTELRNAGLTDLEILDILVQGMFEYRKDIATSKVARISPLRFSRMESRLRKLGKVGISFWREDILYGESGWKVFWGAVKAVAGACIAAANIAGAVETVGATIVSVASGVGVIASGMQDMEELTN